MKTDFTMSIMSTFSLFGRKYCDKNEIKIWLSYLTEPKIMFILEIKNILPS